MVRSRTVKLCEHVHLVYSYIPMILSRPQGKRTTCNCHKSEGDLFVQLYGRSALIAPINGTVAHRSCDQQDKENIQYVV